jgi:hypothetical protein
MSLRTWRQHWLTRGLATVLALLVSGSALELAHPGNDDPDCNPILVVHDHNAHRIATQPGQPSPEGHCFICHSLRLLHAARTMRGARVAAPQAIAFVSPFVHRAVPGGHVAATTSRGPPAIHL